MSSMRSFAATSSLRSVPSGMPIDVFVNETFDDDEEEEEEEVEDNATSKNRPTSADAGRISNNNELETLAPPIRKPAEVR